MSILTTTSLCVSCQSLRHATSPFLYACLPCVYIHTGWPFLGWLLQTALTALCWGWMEVCNENGWLWGSWCPQHRTRRAVPPCLHVSCPLVGGEQKIFHERDQRVEKKWKPDGHPYCDFFLDTDCHKILLSRLLLLFKSLSYFLTEVVAPLEKRDSAGSRLCTLRCF